MHLGAKHGRYGGDGKGKFSPDYLGFLHRSWETKASSGSEDRDVAKIGRLFEKMFK